ncbi:MAG: hypothetical protein ACOYJX_05970 [Acutalibacteraceae bacterium]|jgi:hypothetical protein
MKGKNIFWGFFLIISAALIVASQLTDFGRIGFVSIIATVFFSALIINGIFSMEFFQIFTPMAFLYKIYEAPLNLPHIRLPILVLSALMVALGCTLLFRQLGKKKRLTSSPNRADESVDSDYPIIKVSKGASGRYLHADALRGGKISVSFGELEVYFDQVRLNPKGAELKLDCNFASLKLYIPRYWNVTEKITTTLGEVQNDLTQSQPVLTEPLLTLTGNVNLGSIKIIYT